MSTGIGFIQPLSSILSPQLLLLLLNLISLISAQNTAALSCFTCCGCDGSSKTACSRDSAFFLGLKNPKAVGCTAYQDTCGTFVLEDMTSNTSSETFTAKSCMSNSMCNAFINKIGKEIDFFLLGGTKAKIHGASCCNNNFCNSASSFSIMTTTVVATVLLIHLLN